MSEEESAHRSRQRKSLAERQVGGIRETGGREDVCPKPESSREALLGATGSTASGTRRLAAGRLSTTLASQFQ